ncbi:LOW QUALITY PROTEIN: F-box/LRR-repeat protein At3g03360 [Lolium perenne]|uniref:LOW QUALITY PROTEIN: F-box/LRR-repeat protein At3g03360 n=1 Tax=Lolium perenne TaxID=4522 RepID=UPI003A9A09A2
MGLLALNRLMSMQREQMRNRNYSQPQNGSRIASSLTKRNSSPCRQKDDNSHGGTKVRYAGPYLPEEIWHHIYSLVPMRDAARAACVSHAFLRSWRCHLNLAFTKETMCSKDKLRHWTGGVDDKRDRREYNNNIERILANHRCTGVKALELDFYGPYNTKSYNRLNSWLQIAMTQVTKELTLSVLSDKSKYDFPCSLLSHRSGNTIRYLSLDHCALRPTVNLGLRCLTELELYEVRITGDELGRLLSSSFALEKMKLTYCYDIIRLEIPCLLQRLSYLEVFECSSLQVIENKAPNISSFDFAGGEVQLPLAESLQVKKLKLYIGVISYAIDKLPSSVPYLETLTLCSRCEIVNVPMVTNKFLHLKELNISICGWSSNQEYDFLSLASFLDASPTLEIFVLSVSVASKYDLIVGDPSNLRQIPEHRHDKLKIVKITGFRPQKSLVELTRHILESATSLKFLMLDTITVS